MTGLGPGGDLRRREGHHDVSDVVEALPERIDEIFEARSRRAPRRPQIQIRPLKKPRRSGV